MRTLAPLLALAALTPTLQAADLLPPARPIPEVIDHYVDLGLAADGTRPAPQADDATLVRRLALDLVGRIPTVAETRVFLASREPDRRARLVERLMASQGFVQHLADEFDAMLMAERPGGLRDYLTRAFRENRSWDRIFRELMTADERQPATKGSSAFLLPRVSDLDKLTAEVSSLFFGVNVSCARCHDHPLVRDWKQDHFFGMKSFFNRTYEVNGFLGEREYGTVRFKTVAGKDRQARMMFLTGKTADVPGMKEPGPDEQKKENELIEKLKKEKKAPPAAKVSARARLVDLVLQPGQRDFFTRSIVNRTWYRLFGQGLVMPLDQMHSENPPSHPELLEWLARDTADHGYDLRRLVRGIALSKTYSRSSRYELGDTPRASLFAVARVRALTPLQLGSSLRLAGTDPQALPADPAHKDFDSRVTQVASSGRGLAHGVEQPGEDFQVGVNEALLFSNGGLMNDLLSDAAGRLVHRLKETKDPREQVALAVRAVLSREPSAEETKHFTDYLAGRKDRPVDALRQVVWALATSADFRFNY